jgi:hypothetical protein
MQTSAFSPANSGVLAAAPDAATMSEKSPTAAPVKPGKRLRGEDFIIASKDK